MTLLKKIKVFLLFICLVSSFSGYSYRCYGEPLHNNQYVPFQESTDKHNPDGPFALNKDDGTSEKATKEIINSLETEIAHMKSQRSHLNDALLGPSDRGPRVPRSLTESPTRSDMNCTCRGDAGPDGPPGIPGRDGRDGRDAPMPCERGSQLDNNPDQVSTPLPVDQTQAGRRADGVYVRWGRTVCREGSQLIYEGVIGGTYYTAQGGATNHQCLPLDPIYDLVINGNQDLRAYMYGAEMQTRDDGEWSTLFDHSPPCAVCLSLQRPTILMIPARNICPSSEWTLEYKGQLMAERSNHYRSEFICVDRHPETVPGTAANVNEMLLHLVEGRCISGGGLPCGPYIEGHELSCAVCSK